MSFWSDKPLRRREEEEDIEEEEVDDDNNMEAVNDNLPSQPIITDTEVQEILNNESCASLDTSIITDNQRLIQ